MVSKTLLIGERGQITLPKKIRDIFKTKSVLLKLLDNNNVIISPITDVSGSIADYAKKSNDSFDTIRKNAWSNSRNHSNQN